MSGRHIAPPGSSPRPNAGFPAFTQGCAGVEGAVVAHGIQEFRIGAEVARGRVKTDL
jgi:hypothetical protein